MTEQEYKKFDERKRALRQESEELYDIPAMNDLKNAVEDARLVFPAYVADAVYVTVDGSRQVVKARQCSPGFDLWYYPKNNQPITCRHFNCSKDQAVEFLRGKSLAFIESMEKRAV